MPKSTFHHYVEIGRIKRKVPPGRQEGYYEKNYIDKMAEATELAAIQYAEDPAVFTIAAEEDIPGIYDVLISLWGPANATTNETRLSWHRVNPEIDYVVKQEGIIVGFVNLKPLKPETMEKYVAGTIQVKDIRADEILPFTPGIPLECEAGIAVRAGVQYPKKYAMRLIAGMIKVAYRLAERGVIIRRIYTRSSTPDGIQLARGLGFEDITQEATSSTRLLVLDFETSRSPFVQQYNHILKQGTASN